MVRYYTYDTIIGALGIAADDNAIYQVSRPGFMLGRLGENRLILAAYRQLTEYFNGWRKEFDLPLKQTGSDFYKEVWTKVQTIPYGETITYGQLAAMMNKPEAYRAIGGAVNHNPLPLFIPCHRVIGQRYKMTGYSLGLPAKQTILDLEQLIKEKEALRARA